MRRYSKQSSSLVSDTKNNTASTDNASNRPIKLNALEEAIIKQAKQEVTIRTNSANGPKTETILLGDAVLKRQFKSAIDGSPHAQNQVLKRLQETLSREQTIIQDAISIGEKFKTIQERALAKAIENNQDIDSVLPHPDDIIIDDKTGFAQAV